MDLATLDPAQKRALLAERLRQGARPGATRHAPLSLAQQRLWLIDQMQPGQSVYTITAALRLRGRLDAGRLSAALDRIRARHEALRTRFTDENGSPVQCIDPPAPLALDRQDLAPDALAQALALFAAAPFDLAAGPLVRCALFRLTPDEHVLAFAAHHIIADYRSLQIMIAELVALYRDPALPPLPAQYADHALAERRRVAELAGQGEYWRDRLAGLAPLLDLPTDFPRPAHQDFTGARHRFALPEAVAGRVETLALDRGVTPFMLLLAGFHILHRRYAGTEDICIGTTVSNRGRAELQGLVGYFVNTLALRCTVADDDSFDSLLARIRTTVTGALAHQELPFEQVVDATVTERSLAHTPLFQSMFTLHERQPAPAALPGLEIAAEPLAGRNARFDLCLDLFRGDGITGVLEYATALFRPETAARMAADYVRILDAATADPTRPLADIDLLDETDRQVVAAFNDTARPLPGADLAALIAETAQARGDATALIAGDARLSHAELDAAAGRLAGYLAPHLRPGDRVAICLPRTPDLVVALLAALKLGVAYVPLDPTHPPKRLEMILTDAAPTLMLVAGEAPVDAPCPVLDLIALQDRIAPCQAPERRIAPDDLAYVIFTSGTTGRPKGVPIRQDSLVNLLTSMAERPGMGPDDRLVAVTTPAFDIAALELFLPLLTGGTLVLADSLDVIDGLALSRLIGRSGATMMQATPATWRLLVEEGWRAPQGFRMLSGGEALDADLAARLLDGGGRLWNLYGPTETTIWSACAEIARDCAAIPLGTPVANTQLHVLDRAGQPCPPNVAGELMIGGAGLSPGYLDRPDLTQDRFVIRDGARLYRTGDRVRRLADGRLVYLGRFDHQIKLRGFRIELGEIEARLAADPDVEQAVVTLRGSGDDAMLVAHCRSGAGDAIMPRLRAALAEHLPGYMIPAAFVVLETFPLNANGKIDRARLPAPSASALPVAGPETPAEAIVARLWEDLLNVPPPGRDADFFALGGHSLLAMRMIARLPHKGPRAVPLRLLFENPRLSDFAAALDRDGLLGHEAQAPIPHLPEGVERPLSYAQSRQWALAAIDPGTSAYNLPAALRLTGPVDAARLERACALLFGRHDILRSTYPADHGRARVRIHPAPEAPLARIAVGAGDLTARLRAEAERPFDLATGPLARITLFGIAPGDHALLLVLHHIIGDAMSVEVLLRDLMAIYAALGSDPDHRPAPLPVQYTDYAAWQRGQDLDGAVAWWTETLRGAPPLLELPTDFPRPARQGFDGGSVEFALSGTTARRLRDLARTADATPYMMLLSAWAALLGRYAGTDEVVIGTPVTSRPHPDLDDLAGMFANTLALRLPADDAGGFTALLRACRDRVLAGLQHQDAPFERIVDALEPERSLSQNPVFQTLFAWKTREAAPPPLPGGLEWQALALAGGTAKMDVSMGVLDRGEDFALTLEYRRDLFRPETATHMARAFEALVEALLAAPDSPVAEMSLLHPEQARRIALWNDTGRVPTDGPQTLHGLFAAQVARDGARIAVRDGRHAVSYAALDARSDALAAHLQGLGIGPGHRVGIALPRRIDLIAALLAVLKTGAAYVPMDPRYPAERIAYIAADADLSLVLTAGAAEGPSLDLERFWDGAPGIADTHRSTPPRPAPVTGGREDLAYLIYTSGSTGLPKGVALDHGNAVALVRWAEGAFGPDELSGMLASTSICFDLSVFEIFVTLSLGGTLLLVDDLFGLADAPFRDQVTLINTVPTPMAELLRLGPLPASVRTVCLAGEVLPPALAARIHAEPQVGRLWNLYGPSEDTTYSTGMILPREGGFNIGRPILGTQAHILDAGLRPVPPGMPGELYLSGAGVGRGYWNRPELTAERFLPNPFDHDGTAPVMYRTGDRARRAADGSIDYLGRGDRQVKLRGFRIEPGEIEAVLTLLPGVTGAAVAVLRDIGDHGRLVAWVEGDATPETLAAALTRRLPAHMVPGLFVMVEALPRLPNGKLDRNALPMPGAAPAATPQTEAPQPGTEAALAVIWREVLGRDAVSRHDNFFVIGGDSILAIQVVAKAREAGIALAPRDLFEHATLAALAGATAGRAPIGRAQGPATGRQALTPIQRWFLGRDLPEAGHWNQALVLTPARDLDPALLRATLATLADWHDALRARFIREGDDWQQHYAEPGGEALLIETQGGVTEAATRLQEGFALDGTLWGAVLATNEAGQRLAVAAHHLIVDGVSWRILLGDLQRIYEALESGRQPAEPPRSTGAGAWADFLCDADFTAALPLWAGIEPAEPLPLDDPQGANTEGDATRIESRIDADLTRRLLQDLPAVYPASTQDVLVAALYLALRDWTGSDRLVLETESHGRPDLSPQIELSRTVGWLTGLYPTTLTAAPGAAPGEVLRMVKETLRAVPDDGISYGVLRHLAGRLAADPQAQVRFNYLGQAGALFGPDSLFRPAMDSAGPTRGASNPRDLPIEINAIADDRGLRLNWNFSPRQIAPATIEGLAAGFARMLDRLVSHCIEGEDSGFIAADFPDMDLAQDDLEDLLRSL